MTFLDGKERIVPGLITSALIALASVLFVSGTGHAAAEHTSEPGARNLVKRQVLFTNVNIFNGTEATLIRNGSVLVEGNLIKTVSSKPIDVPDAYKIDGGGRTLMPWLMDAHVHLAPTVRIALKKPESAGLDPNSVTAKKLRQVNEGASN